MRQRNLIIGIGFLLTAALGYLVARSTAQRPQKAETTTELPTPALAPKVVQERAVTFNSGATKSASRYRKDDDAADAGALQGQRNVVFRDREALEDFLRRAGDQVKILGRLDALNALRVAFLNPDDLAGLLDGDEEMSFIFPVDIPVPGEGSAQAGAVELGAGLLEWLGIEGDNSAWGTGVRIAILDTGVAAHQAFSSSINGTNLVDLPADLSMQNGHGTAVASVIIGNNSFTPGVAPGAEIYSYRIANDLGQSDSFLLAQGIVAAVDGGAQLINISMASLGDSALVRNAIEYARSAGSLIIAAAGNNGMGRVSYPAANSGVIAVGAVDAMGEHMAFSNSGDEIAISAPGFGVNAAWTENQAVRVNGTSFSSPIIAGSIAALMSQPGSQQLTASQAVDLLFSYLNDGGAPGKDPSLGAGMPDLGRVMNRNNRGIYDAAVASQRLIPPSPSHPYGQLEVLIQNRGTEPLVNTGVRISTPNGDIHSNITTLSVNDVRSIIIPVPYHTTSSIRFGSSVSLQGNVADAKPSNDQRAQTYAPTSTK